MSKLNDLLSPDADEKALKEIPTRVRFLLNQVGRRKLDGREIDYLVKENIIKKDRKSLTALGRIYQGRLDNAKTNRQKKTDYPPERTGTGEDPLSGGS